MPDPGQFLSHLLVTCKRVTNSLIFRMAALGGVSVLLGLATYALVVIPLLQKDVAELVANQQLSIASYVAQDIDAKVLARRNLIRSLATDLSPETLTNPARLAAWLKSRQQLYPLFNNGLLVLRPDGKGLLADYPVIAGRSHLLTFADAAMYAAKQAGRGRFVFHGEEG